MITPLRNWLSVCFLLLPSSILAQSTADKAARVAASESSVSILVNPGVPVEATAYYRRLQVRIGLPLIDAADNLTANLDQLIKHFGFTGLSAKDLEELGSFDLMPSDTASFDALAARVSDPAAFKASLTFDAFRNDNVLVSRFFAPKIVDYSSTPPFTPGWRKLVRLKALAGSDAFKANLLEAYILFNFVRADAAVDPFDKNTSKNNQVILVPRTFTKGTEDSAFFMVFLRSRVTRWVWRSKASRSICPSSIKKATSSPAPAPNATATTRAAVTRVRNLPTVCFALLASTTSIPTSGTTWSATIFHKLQRAPMAWFSTAPK